MASRVLGAIPAQQWDREHSTDYWELCPHKSPGDVASRHLPRSQGKTRHTVIFPSLPPCVGL